MTRTYIVAQIDDDPGFLETGTLKPLHANGYYNNRPMADAEARRLKEKHPELTTVVVSIDAEVNTDLSLTEYDR